MSRIRNIAVAVSASTVLFAGLQAGQAHAATAPVAPRAEIVGQLGYEGGAYPGGFHPTAGIVEVEFVTNPLVLVKKVGRSGNFKLSLSAGTYDLVGCGPAATTPVRQCSAPLTVTLAAGEIDHVRLVWALVP